MDASSYVRGFARRWKVILACVLVALAIGFVVTSGQSGSAPTTTQYQATTYLLGTSSSSSFRGDNNLTTVATIATLGVIPERVAEAIGYEGDPQDLAETVVVEGDENTGLLSIEALGTSAARAEELADTWAEELLGFLRDRNLEEVRRLRAQIRQLTQEIAELDAELEQPDEGSTDEDKAGVQEERDTADLQLQALTQQYSQLAAETGGVPEGFEVIEPATAQEVSTDPGIQAPRSRLIRLLIAVIIGLLFGVGISLLLERFDTRIRTKEEAEESFGLPVLAEIPPISRRKRSGVVVDAFPRAPASNAFRLLAAALQFGRHDGSARDTESNGHPGSPTILVTSSVPAEGKSTIVANLAATYADLGKRVVVVCCDFRHPTIHETLKVEQGPGLADALVAESQVPLEPLLQESRLDRVRVLATGHVPEKTGGLFGSPHVGQVLDALRSEADVVLIDTAPVLASSDWTQLLPEVDSVLVVARSGKTDRSDAARTAEILAILGAPVVGIAMNGLARSPSRRDSYRYRYHREASTEPTDETSESADVSGNGAAGPAADTGAEQEGAESSRGGFPHLARPSTKE